MFRDISIFVYDYIEFCYGGMYFLLALFAAFLFKNDYSRVIRDSKHELPKLPWDIFAFAVMLYGVINWISIFALPFNDIRWILPLDYVVIVVSCFTLFKFASEASKILKIDNYFGSKYLVIMLALAFIFTFIDAKLGLSAVHLLVVFPPVVQCFLAFYKLNKDYNLKYVFLYGVFFILHLICRFIDYFNKIYVLDGFEQMAGVLIPGNSAYHFASIVFFVVAALCFMKFAKDQLREKNFLTHSVYFPLCLLIFLISGIFFTNWRVSYVDGMFKTTIMRIASGIARTVNIAKQNSYFLETGTRNAKTNFSDLIKSYSRFEPMLIKPCGVFTLRKERDKYFVNNDGNLLKKNKFVAEHNVEYVENIDSMDYAIDNRTPVVVGPYHNRFGEFLTAYVPLTANGLRNNAGILGLDVESENWKNVVGRVSVGSLLYLMFLMAFPILAYTVNVSIKYSDSRLKWFFEGWYALALGVSIYMIVFILSIAYVATDYNQIYNRQSFYCTADAKGQCINEAINNETTHIKWILFNVSGNKIWFKNNEEFSDFAMKTNNFASLNNLRLIAAVPGKNLDSFEKEISKLTNRSYHISSYVGSGKQIVPDIHNLNRVYWPALFTFPYDELSLGLNYASFPHLKSAINAVLRTNGIYAVAASVNGNISRFHGEMMVFGPSNHDENGNINSIFVAFINFQDIVDRINRSAYNENSNYDYEVEIDIGLEKQPLASYPKFPDKKRIEGWRSASLGYLYPIFALGKTILVKIYPKSNYSNSDFWTTNTFVATASAGIVFALVFSLFFVYQQINQQELEEVFEQKISEAEKRAGLVKEITEKLPVISYRIKKRDKDDKFDTIFINSEIEKWTGIGASDFFDGKYSIFDIVQGPESSNINKLVIEAVSEHKTLEIEGQFKNIITNEVSWGYGRAIPAFTDFGELKWVDGFFIDISEEKAAEEKQKAAIEEIEKINDILKEENEKTKVLALQAESSEKAQEAFVNSIKKEVEEPVASIVELSRKLMDTKLPDEQRDYANIISNNSLNMLKIFDEIIVSKEAGTQTAETPSDNRA